MSEITSSSVEVGDQIAGAVEVPTPYAEPLQESLDRPITDDVLEATEELMLDRLIDAVEAG